MSAESSNELRGAICDLIVGHSPADAIPALSWLLMAIIAEDSDTIEEARARLNGSAQLTSGFLPKHWEYVTQQRARG